MAEVFPAAATEGFRRGMARYGLLLDYMEFAVVNRFVYLCPRGVGAPKGAKGPPPKLIFKALTHLHPEIRRRARTIAETFATKRWRQDVISWDSEHKPAIARENSALQAADTRAMTDEHLAAHLRRCFDAARRSILTHHSFNPTAMLPVGDFLVHVREWTGLAPTEVLPLFRGASRVSQGAIEELDALARVVSADAGAMTTLASTDPHAVIDALIARKDPVGVAARLYVDAAGVRIASGYDVADVTLAEMPELLVANIRAAIEGKAGRTTDDVAARESSIRDRVPGPHRNTFDELLNEARLTYRMRDERTYFNDLWAFGIARRAILAAGMRLAAKGMLQDAEHAVELTEAEIVSMLAGGRGRSSEEAAADAQFRVTHTFRDAPQFLGGTPSEPPPAEWLTGAAARGARATAIVLGEMFAARSRDAVTSQVTGFAASPGLVSGIARLVLDPRDMGRVRKGEILITRATAPSYNALLPLLGGIVTDRGGTLSHAAVVAREYGIPAVVGTGDATERIRDGMRIRIDGSSGTVELLP